MAVGNATAVNDAQNKGKFVPAYAKKRYGGAEV
jgi:hypothetical protein